MENEKNNKEKTIKNKAITIRIEQTVLEQYNNKLEQIYHKKNHRKQSSTINDILKQFNKQDTDKLREYIKKDIPILNLTIEQIQEYQQKITEKDNEIQSIQNVMQEKIASLTSSHNQEIQEKEKTITALESSQKQLEQTITEKYKDEIQTLKNAIKQNQTTADEKITSLTSSHNQEIQALKQIIAEKEKTITDKDNTIEKQQKTIDTLNTELTQSHKDVRTARSDYKHQTENLNKLQQEYNDIQNENKDYTVAFAEIKKMSILERIRKKYPKKMLELSDGN